MAQKKVLISRETVDQASVTKKLYNFCSHAVENVVSLCTYICLIEIILEGIFLGIDLMYVSPLESVVFW